MFPITRSVPVAADLISGKKQRKHTGVTPSTGGRQELADSGELEGKSVSTQARSGDRYIPALCDLI